MTNEERERVFSLLCEMLEEQAFLLPDALPEDQVFYPGNGLVVKLDAQGSRKCSMRVAIPDMICDEIAENLLGCDSDDPEFPMMRRDAVGELVNVLAGGLFYSVAGEEQRLSFGSPVVENLTESEWNDLTSAEGRITVDVGGSPLALDIAVEAAGV